MVYYTVLKGKAEHLYSALHGKDHFKALRHGSRSIFNNGEFHVCQDAT